MNTRKRFLPLYAALSVLVSAMVAAVVWQAGMRTAAQSVASNAQSRLALASSTVLGEVAQYRELAILLARHPDVVRAAASGVGNLAGKDVILEAADMFGPINVQILSATGEPLASARPEFTPPPADAEYIQRAMQIALGVTPAGKIGGPARSFAIAAPIIPAAGAAQGVLLVSGSIERIETQLISDPSVYLFLDEDGDIFIANRSELLPGEDEALTSYASLNVSEDERWNTTVATLDAGRYLPHRAVKVQQELPTVGLTALGFASLAPAYRLAGFQALSMGGVALLFMAAIGYFVTRREALANANILLEERVQMRTSELRESNAALSHEVAERRMAQRRLQLAQAELVRAGKLSALGKLSAGITHELNQPLMALRSFAENGQVFLDRCEPEKARDNLVRISELSNRIDRIIRNLRAFAKQETLAVTDVDVVRVVHDALETTAQLREPVPLALRLDLPDHPVWARAGDVRLQQIVVNLITNALDAMESTAAPRLEISVSETRGEMGGEVQIHVRDNGPGIAEPEQIFDPFFTTKSVGEAKGMGLGLSISYGLVQSFGGDIRAQNMPGGGAEMTVILKATQTQEAAS